MMLGIGVFLFVALVPTGLALWFLRRHRPTWSVFTIAGLAVAVAGLATVLAMGLQRSGPHARWLVLVDLFSVAHMIRLACVSGGLRRLRPAGPGGDLRRRLLVAAGIELVIAACSLVRFLAPRLPI